MTNVKFSRSKFEDDELKEAILTNPGISHRALARMFGVDESTIRARRIKLVRQGWAPDKDLTHEIPEGQMLKGASTLYGADGEIKLQWIKTSEDKERQNEAIKAAIEAMIEDLPKQTPQTVMNEHLINDNLMTVYPIGDPHFGMLSWGEETGQDWDLAIAEEVFCGIFKRVVESAPNSKQAVVLNLGDMFHYDNLEGQTTRSHNSLDCDGRYAKMVRIGVRIIRQMITTALEHHETVKVINVVGNHDDTGALFLSVCLKHVYENEPRVIVDDSPTAFHYVRFGKVLLCAHHGHSCKMDKIPGVMAADRPEDWGETKYRYGLLGHVHHDHRKEFPGCLVESFRTLAAKDAYATWGGWRSGQDQKAIVYHKDYGEVQRSTIDIAQLYRSEMSEKLGD